MPRAAQQSEAEHGLTGGPHAGEPEAAAGGVGELDDGLNGGSTGDGFLDEMGEAFGADFSTVRIHQGDGLADAMGAEAVAHGDDIHLAAHRSPDDRELIGHELAHVVQQREGRVAAPQSKDGEVVDPALEAEADRAGAAVARGEEAPAEARARTGASRAGDASIQANRNPLKGLDLYLYVQGTHVWAALQEHLAAIPWPAPHPDVAWADSKRFGLAIASSLKGGVLPLDEPNEIAKRVFPVDHREVLKPYLPGYTDTWLPGLGHAFAQLIADATRARGRGPRPPRRLGPRTSGSSTTSAPSSIRSNKRSSTRSSASEPRSR